MHFLEFMFSGFWVFVGMMMLIALMIKGVYALWCRLLRVFTMHKHGYPPPHCDGDGDFTKVEDDED
jgi:hypothetical protein